MNEMVFKPVIIDGITSDYYVTTDGEILDNNLKPLVIGETSRIWIGKNNGYVYVRIPKPDGGDFHPCLLHRIVAQAFISNPDNLPTVNHKLGGITNKQKNSVQSLEWMSYSDNNIHALNNNLRTPLKCENHQYATLTNNQVHEICKLLEKNMLYDDIITELSLGDIKNIRSKIKMIKTGNAWTDISKNYNIPECRNMNMKFSDDELHQICEMFQNGIRGYSNILRSMGKDDTPANQKLLSSLFTRKKYKRISKDYVW